MHAQPPLAVVCNLCDARDCVALCRYQKIYAKRRKFAVHDEADACRVGDVVEFAETRKFSKTKAHMVTQIVKPEDYVRAFRGCGRLMRSQTCVCVVLTRAWNCVQIDRDEPRRRRTEERDFDEIVSVNGS